MVFFGILSSLGIAYSSEAEFLAHCWTMDREGREIERLSELPEVQDTGPSWKRTIRSAYGVAFLAVWLAFVVSFYDFGKSFRSGSPVPTATQSEPLEQGGETHYVTPAQKKRIDFLQRVSFIGMPMVIVGGVVLHFLLGIKLYDNTPTLAEYLSKRTHQLKP